MTTILLAAAWLVGLSAHAQFQLRYEYLRPVDETIGERTIQTTSNGGTIRVGTITHASGDTDVVVTRFHANGSVQWSRTFGDPNARETGDAIVRVDQVGKGGFLVVGSTDNGSGGNDLDVLALSIGSNGKLHWAHRYGRPSHFEWAVTAIEDTDSDTFKIVGRASDRLAPVPELYVISVYDDGTVHTQADYVVSGRFYDESVSVTRTEGSASFVLAAKSRPSSNVLQMDVLLVEFDHDLQPLRQRLFSTPAAEEPTQVLALPDGNLLVAGLKRGCSFAVSCGFLLRLDAGWNEVWNTTYEYLDVENYILGVAEDRINGGFVAAGIANMTGCNNTCPVEGWLFQVDDVGSPTWAYSFPDSLGDHWFEAIEADGLNGFVVAGMDSQDRPSLLSTDPAGIGDCQQPAPIHVDTTVWGVSTPPLTRLFPTGDSPLTMVRDTAKPTEVPCY